MGLYKMILNEATVNSGVEVFSRAGKKTVMTLPHGIIVQEWLIAYFASSSTAGDDVFLNLLSEILRMKLKQDLRLCQEMWWLNRFLESPYPKKFH